MRNLTLLALIGFILGLAQLAHAQDESLLASYRKIQARAVKIAGAPGDIPTRVKALLAIYQDSEGNHSFPLVAAHGASWGYNYFKLTGPIGETISYRYFYDSQEKKRRLKMLNDFAESFKAVNRQVFIDTYTNYYFTKLHGKDAGASALINPELLKKLQIIHEARRSRIALSDKMKKDVFKTSLVFEQEKSVGPAIELAVKKFDCPILRTLVLKPIVQFAYFPAFTVFSFNDFSDKAERIQHATRAYELAQQAGWDQVESLLSDY